MDALKGHLNTDGENFDLIQTQAICCQLLSKKSLKSLSTPR